jgi:hypothetical protein
MMLRTCEVALAWGCGFLHEALISDKHFAC